MGARRAGILGRRAAARMSFFFFGAKSRGLGGRGILIWGCGFNSFGLTFGVEEWLCLCCSAIHASAAVQLSPMQTTSKDEVTIL